MTTTPKRLAAIDIGTNTIKIKIVDVFSNAKVKQVFYKDFPSGLGKHISNENVIGSRGINDCVASLKKIKKIIVEQKVDSYKCIATHALRVAKNKKEILSTIKTKTGFDVEVISGKREAELTLQGILMDFSPKKNFACINAGGGSTELSFHIDGINQFYVFKFGALNVYQDYLKDIGKIDSQIKKVEALITNQFKKVDSKLVSATKSVICIGGSIFNIAYILRKDTTRDFGKLNKFKITLGDLEATINLLKKTPNNQRKNIPGLDTKRSDTVLSGALIVYFILQLLDQKEFVVSTRTISDGILSEMY